MLSCSELSLSSCLFINLYLFCFSFGTGFSLLNMQCTYQLVVVFCYPFSAGFLLILDMNLLLF
jgi:hypothetical protein